MSVTPIEYHRNTNIVSTNSMEVGYDQNIFSTSKCRKVELHDLSSKVLYFNGKFFFFQTKFLYSFPLSLFLTLN